MQNYRDLAAGVIKFAVNTELSKSIITLSRGFAQCRQLHWCLR